MPVTLQFAPPSVLLKTPAEFPAYTMAGFIGSTARVAAAAPVRPLWADAQLTPPLSDFITPAEFVLKKRTLGLSGAITRVAIPRELPVHIGFQLAPPSVLL